MKARIDAILSKWLSRKLMVFIVSACALFMGKIQGEDWVIISTAYIAIEGTIDAVTRLKGVKLPNKEENNSI